MLTTDALVAGVHFFADDPPGAIARKALRVNLSDLAAKGAGRSAFCSRWRCRATGRADWLAAFAGGLGDDAAAYACPLVGGDTVKTPGPLTLSITAFGAVARADGRAHRRQAGRPALRQRHDRRCRARPRDPAGRGPDIAEADIAFLLDRYLLPQPRIALAGAMARLRERRHGRLRRLRRRSDEDARVSGRQRARRSSAAAVAPPRARRSRPIPLCSRLRRPAATTMKSSPRRRRESRAAFEAAAAAAGVAGDADRRGARGRRAAALHRRRRRPVRLRARRLQPFLKGRLHDRSALTSMPQRCALARRWAIAREAGALARRRFLDRRRSPSASRGRRIISPRSTARSRG